MVLPDLECPNIELVSGKSFLKNFLFEKIHCQWLVSWPTAIPNTVDSCLHHLAVDSIIWPDAHCPKAIHCLWPVYCLYVSLIYELTVPKGTL